MSTHIPPPPPPPSHMCAILAMHSTWLYILGEMGTGIPVEAVKAIINAKLKG